MSGPDPTCVCCGRRWDTTGGCLACSSRTSCAACGCVLSCSCGRAVDSHECPMVVPVWTPMTHTKD